MDTLTDTTENEVRAWNGDDPTFYTVDDDGQFLEQLPHDYCGLCSLNGFLYSTGISPDGRRWWFNVEASNPIPDREARIRFTQFMEEDR